MNELKYKINQMFIAKINSDFSDDTINDLSNNFIGNFLISYDNNKTPYEIYEFNKLIFEKTISKINIKPIIAIENENILKSSSIITAFPNKAAIISSKLPLACFRCALYNSKELSALGFTMSMPQDGEYTRLSEPRSGIDYNEFNYYKEKLDSGYKNSFIFCTDIEKILSLYSFEKHHPNNNSITGKTPAALISRPFYHNFTPQLLSENFSEFKGIIINNFSENEEIKKYYSKKDILLNGIACGTNMFVVSCKDISEYSKIIFDAVKTNKISKNLIDDNFNKIKRIKKKYNLFPANFEYAKKIVNNQKHIKLSHEISQKSIRLISGNKFNVRNAAQDKTAVIAPYSTPNNLIDQINPFNVDFSFFISHKFSFHPFHYLYNFNKTYIDNLIKNLKEYEYVIYAVNNLHENTNQLDLYNQLICQNKKIIAISLSSPDQFPKKPYSHYCIHEYTPLSIRSLCKILSGFNASDNQ